MQQAHSTALVQWGKNVIGWSEGLVAVKREREAERAVVAAACVYLCQKLVNRGDSTVTIFTSLMSYNTYRKTETTSSLMGYI